MVCRVPAHTVQLGQRHSQCRCPARLKPDAQKGWCPGCPVFTSKTAYETGDRYWSMPTRAKRKPAKHASECFRAR